MAEVPPAPRLVKLAAYLVPLCVLPSSVWRIIGPVGTGYPEGCPLTMDAGDRVYIASLSVISVGTALLTLGLVQRWGVVFPGWVPRLGGRIVPARPVVAIASTGAALIWSIYVWAVLNPIFRWYQPPPWPEECDGSLGAGVAAAYAPLPLWAPLLTVVIVDYWRRRRLAQRASAGHG